MVDAATAAADCRDGRDSSCGAPKRQRGPRCQLVMVVVVGLVLACA